MREIGRRQFITGAATGAAVLAAGPWVAAPTQAAPSRRVRLRPYQQPLQVPPVVDLRAGGAATLAATSLQRRLHPQLAPTPVWSYRSAGAVDPNPGGYGGYLGPTIVTRRGVPAQVSYVNALDAHHYSEVPWLPYDRNLMHPDHRMHDMVTLLAHLHGAHVWGQMDGNPTIDRGYTHGEAQTVWYGNDQRAALNWYHDHGMATTRLNVWAGLAGAYLIRDEFDTGERDNPLGLPSGYGTGPGCYEVPLVFQDRSFSPDSRFHYPTIQELDIDGGTWGMDGLDPNYYGTSTGPWSPEGFGDTMLVNGLVAPYHAVEPRLYRFRVLNGSNARILDLQAQAEAGGAPPPMYVIGTDGGMLPEPVPVRTLTLMPAERLDVLVDLSDHAGTRVHLRNTRLDGAYTSPAPLLTDGLQLRVGTAVTDRTSSRVPTTLAGGEVARTAAPTVAPRMIMMNEANANLPGWFMALSGSGGGGVTVPGGSGVDRTAPVAGTRYNTFDDPIGELPPEGCVQEWDFHNMTMDSHPMHMHLVQFQVVHRRADGTDPATVAEGTGVAAFERGWKDTVAVHPMQVTRVRAHFVLPSTPAPIAPPAGFVPEGTSPKYTLVPGEAERTFVYHCHILEHEENDMMRPFRVASA